MFTQTHVLCSGAFGIRELSWDDVPGACGKEEAVEEALTVAPFIDHASSSASSTQDPFTAPHMLQNEPTADSAEEVPCDVESSDVLGDDMHARGVHETPHDHVGEAQASDSSLGDGLGVSDADKHQEEVSGIPGSTGSDRKS